jgi:hypothetical protein
MKDLFESHLGQEIGINLTRAHRIESAQLLSVGDGYFSVKTDADENLSHVPFANIVKVIENPEGVAIGGLFRTHKSHAFVVKIGHVVEYAPT